MLNKTIRRVPSSLRMGRIEFYLNLAVEYRLRATCLRNRVGCILTYGDRLVSAGYNSSPSGLIHCIDGEGCIVVEEHCIRPAHAEISAIMHLEHQYDELIAYITTQPCLNCLRQLIMANVKKVYYIQRYPDLNRDRLANEADIKMIQVFWPKKLT